MAFNANTYRMNKWRREAWAKLKEARELRARVTAGEAYEWEAPLIGSHVQTARCFMRLHLACRAIHEIERSTDGTKRRRRAQ
jgi:hypothetical protein